MCLLVVGGSLTHVVLIAHFGVMFVSLLLFYRLFSFGVRSLIRVGVASAACAAVVLVWRVSVSEAFGGGFGAYEKLLGERIPRIELEGFAGKSSGGEPKAGPRNRRGRGGGRGARGRSRRQGSSRPKK